MVRTVVKIDGEKCNGCGACAKACHEGAIGMVGGKAKLLRDDYCDGMGDCLPECPVGAISFEEREAAAYDAKAVAEHKKPKLTLGGTIGGASELNNWPVQIKLAPLSSPCFDGAELLIAADCSAFAYGAFHRDFIRGRAVVIGCPKLDGLDYSVKLGEILKRNDVRSVTVTRMEVPCCGGLEFAARNALEASGKNIPLNVVTISAEGNIL